MHVIGAPWLVHGGHGAPIKMYREKNRRWYASDRRGISVTASGSFWISWSACMLWRVHVRGEERGADHIVRHGRLPAAAVASQ
jgi:hypothetical protein